MVLTQNQSQNIVHTTNVVETHHSVRAVSLLFFDTSGRLLPLSDIIIWLFLLPIHLIRSLYLYIAGICDFTHALIPSTLPLSSSPDIHSQHSQAFDVVLAKSTREAEIWQNWTMAHAIWEKQCEVIQRRNSSIVNIFSSKQPLPPEPQQPTLASSPLLANTREVLAKMRQRAGMPAQQRSTHQIAASDTYQTTYPQQVIASSPDDILNTQFLLSIIMFGAIAVFFYFLLISTQLVLMSTCLVYLCSFIVYIVLLSVGIGRISIVLPPPS